MELIHSPTFTCFHLGNESSNIWSQLSATEFLGENNWYSVQINIQLNAMLVLNKRLLNNFNPGLQLKIFFYFNKHIKEHNINSGALSQVKDPAVLAWFFSVVVGCKGLGNFSSKIASSFHLSNCWFHSAHFITLKWKSGRA